MGEVITSQGQLAGICGHDGSDWEKVLIDASKRLVVAVAALSGNVEVIQDTPGDLLTGVHHYDGSAWRKSNLLWGYHDIWDENLGGTATTTSWAKATSTIPSGEVWVLQAISALNATRDPSNISLYITRASGSTVYLASTNTPGLYRPVLATGNWVLGAGDLAYVYLSGCQADDVILGGIIGYKMDIEM